MIYIVMTIMGTMWMWETRSAMVSLDSLAASQLRFHKEAHGEARLALELLGKAGVQREA